MGCVGGIGNGRGLVLEDHAGGSEAYARRRVGAGEQFANRVDCVFGECGKICHVDFRVQGVLEKGRVEFSMLLIGREIEVASFCY